MGGNSIHPNMWDAQIFQWRGALKWQHIYFTFPTCIFWGMFCPLMPPRVILNTHKSPHKFSFQWFNHDFPGRSWVLCAPSASSLSWAALTLPSEILAILQLWCQADHSVSSPVLLPTPKLKCRAKISVPHVIPTNQWASHAVIHSRCITEQQQQWLLPNLSSLKAKIN